MSREETPLFALKPGHGSIYRGDRRMESAQEKFDYIYPVRKSSTF